MKQLSLIWLAISLFLLGCETSVGDKCETSNDCPTGTMCDMDSPGGYCLVSNCETDQECPEDAVCVFFHKDLSYCLKKCKKNSDCRKEYTCRDDIEASYKFCYIAPSGTYGRDENNKLDYEPPSESQQTEEIPAEE